MTLDQKANTAAEPSAPCRSSVFRELERLRWGKAAPTSRVTREASGKPRKSLRRAATNPQAAQNDSRARMGADAQAVGVHEQQLNFVGIRPAVRDLRDRE